MTTIHQPDSTHAPAGREASEVDLRGILGFGLGLFVVAAVVHVLVWLLFGYFTAREAKQQPREYPLAAADANRLPPEPRLQVNPRQDLADFREKEDEILRTYGWMDRNADIVRIPIDAAMTLTLERGLPRQAPEPEVTTRTLVVAVTLVAQAALASAQMTGAPTAGYRSAPGAPASALPAALREIGFDQNLNQLVPLDVPFRDETGRTVALGDYFGKRPVVLVFAYYDCPMLCTLVINGLSSALGVMSLDPGRDFEIVTISFDARDTPAVAAAKKAVYLDRYKRAGAAEGWHFLTGDQSSIDRVTKATGFRYVWDKETKQFAHPTGVIVLTPEGRLASYLFGIEYGPRDLRMAIVEASSGKVGSPVDALLLYCYHYDPETGRYGFVIMRAMRIAGAATVLAIGAFILVMVRREKHAVPASSHQSPATSHQPPVTP